MKIKMLTSMAGSRFTREPGEVCEVSAQEGKRLIDKGFAEKPTREDLQNWAKRQKEVAEAEKAEAEKAAARQKEAKRRAAAKAEAEKLARYEQLKADAASDGVEFTTIAKYEKLIEARSQA